MKRTTGRYERAILGRDEVLAFVPFALPPHEPALAVDNRIGERLRADEHTLTRLDLAGEVIPSLDWFLYAFVRKEAIISSQIKGTQATLIDLLTFEADHETAPDADVEEVCNYIEALSYARAKLANANGLPLSMRILNETHRQLMRGVRGATKQPGDVRRSQNWISGSRTGTAAYVPPPVQSLPDLLGDLEKYLHTDDDLPKLVRIGLTHVQFESIHLYLDGNGRIGRILIALLFEHRGLMKVPILYLSLFFKHHREEYFRRLTAVRVDGDWEGWTDFFLNGVATIADEAVASTRELFTVVTATRLFELLPNQPIITVAVAMKLIETTKPTVTRAIESLVAAGILVEKTGKKRDRSFAYKAYIDRLRIGTELECI